MDGWMDGCIDRGSMDRRIDRSGENRSIHRWIDGWIAQSNRKIDGWMGGRTDALIDADTSMDRWMAETRTIDTAKILAKQGLHKHPWFWAKK